ncbi:cobyrinate a,c-diamide synthase [Candidatus Nitrosotalea okcheonensis]|uniref:Cobyrinate a,c-diamide synthase n=1 Tax=Candidatus Nitrosotalea okcheonensis TaxID=1903276 RepID=A0A2H1FHG5_9ARCH|nr:cobyrinate a,c-diamide synthase [Candidatus Nitrosotalea okcheonensis]SMH72184.1 Cobyrinic acid A,C-diamide synthase [Candidatus Nitrosotalea okcheonensis]
MNIPRIVVAGATSGVGKTSITTAIIHGLKERGYSVQPFKVGPDFIDPSYLSAVSGKIARNLDSWMMGKNTVLENFVQNSQEDISIIEGVMGYYDGFSGKSSFASTYDVANITKSNVILVLDASKAARSVAATALGFKNFEKNSRICGIILNKIGSKKHETLCRDALKKVGLEVLGVIPRDNDLNLESRHLGLVPVREKQYLDKKIKSIAKSLSGFIEVEKIIKLARNGPSLPKIPLRKNEKIQTRIAVALDESFNFYYQDNLDELQRLGAELVFFSPISDNKIPPCAGIYIGGGFPEVKGDLLQKNKTMMRLVKKYAEDGMPIYAECGGLMYLTKSIRYKSGKFTMVGLFDAVTVMEKRLKLNYTSAKARAKSPFSLQSKTVRGHEFHYSELDLLPKDSTFAYDMSIGIGIKDKKDGLTVHNTLASYMHVHFANSPIAANFVKSCISYSRK